MIGLRSIFRGRPRYARPVVNARKKKLLRLSLLLGAILIGVALAWKLAPAIDAEQVAARLESIEKYTWSPLLFVAAYVVGSFVMFPVTLLSAASATIFVPWKAVAISFTGIMISSALLHGIGARWLKDSVRGALGSTTKRVDEAFGDRSIVTIALIRMVPLAPFTLVNLAAGCIGVRFRDFMLGTALGLAPGITVVCLFGRQVRAFWRDPSLTPVLIVGGIALAWIAFSVLLQRWISGRRERQLLHFAHGQK
jgi:phospholipase D1/2